MIETDERRATSLVDELSYTQDRAQEYAAKRLLAIAKKTGFGMGRFDEKAARHVVEMIAKTELRHKPRSDDESKQMEMTELLRSTQTSIKEMRSRLDRLLSELSVAADNARDTYLELYDKATNIDDTQVALEQLLKRATAMKKCAGASSASPRQSQKAIAKSRITVLTGRNDPLTRRHR